MLADETITVFQSGSSNPHQDLTIFNFSGWGGHETEGVVDCATCTGRAINAFDTNMHLY